MKGKTALVVGATGLVGSELIKILLAAPEYERVIIWVRRPSVITDKRLEEKIINFEMLESYEIEGRVDHVFCCLARYTKRKRDIYAIWLFSQWIITCQIIRHL